MHWIDKEPIEINGSTCQRKYWEHSHRARKLLRKNHAATDHRIRAVLISFYIFFKQLERSEPNDQEPFRDLVLAGVGAGRHVFLARVNGDLGAKE